MSQSFRAHRRWCGAGSTAWRCPRTAWMMAMAYRPMMSDQSRIW